MFVAVLMTETVLPLWLVTYTRVPSGVAAATSGRFRPDTVAVTVLVAVSSTDTVRPALLVT